MNMPEMEMYDENDALFDGAQVFEIGEAQSGMRLDVFLAQQFPHFTRSFLSRQIKEGKIQVAGKTSGLKAGYSLREKDVVTVSIAEPRPMEAKPQDIPLDILYEDDDLLIVNKPKGMVVHPAHGHEDGTLVNALLWHCRDNLSGINGVLRPGIVHRLDQDTSGLIVVAKTQAAMDGLAKAFASHANVTKTYLAVVHGRPRLQSGRIENMIGRHPVDRKRMAIVERGGKLAITNWRVLPNQTIKQSNNQTISLLECRIETGRTHQIRVHMASLGCPVIGDRTYGKGTLDRRLDPVPARQMLHAWKLRLWHPVKNVEMSFEAPPPPDMLPYL